jgi:elongation factor Ts
MQVAASAPQYVSVDSIPEADRDAIKAEFTEKVKSEGKPENIAGQIVEGMLKKHFAEKCLMDQPFIKNPDQTVGDYVKEHIAKLGENIVVRRFSRMALGEVTE